MKSFQTLIVLLLIVSCGSNPVTTKPIQQDISESVYASGTIKSKDQYQIYPLVSGIIQEILVDDGDAVKRGDLLMRIDNRSQELTRDNAALIADYNAMQQNQDKLNDAKEAIELAKDKLKTDSLLFVRTSNLFKQNATTQVELEQRELAYQNSRVALQNARTRFNDLKKQLKLNEQQAQNNLAISNKSANDFLIRSDIDGKVYSVLKDKGELVNPQTPIAIVGSASLFILEMQVDEYDIAKINLGQKVLVTMDSYKGRVFEAKVTKVNPIMNERSKTFLVEAMFTKAPPKVFPNTSFEASIVLRTKSNALVIPKRFLLSGDYLMLKNGNKVKVKVGLRDYEFVEIESGLKAKDEIILVE